MQKRTSYQASQLPLPYFFTEQNRPSAKAFFQVSTLSNSLNLIKKNSIISGLINIFERLSKWFTLGFLAHSPLPPPPLPCFLP